MADSLDHLRHEIDALAASDGAFYVACAETNRRPTPLSARRFPTEGAAREAADLARAYRDRLRETDSGLPTHRFVVYEAEDGADADAPTLVSTRERTAGHRANGLPRTSRSVTLSGDHETEWLRMDNAPLVHVSHDGEPLDDDAIARQLDAKL
ncbi:DUF7552 domain-containing protein [Halorussus amylolyticus]|uniref:DUF7552 domain-containing protein n=1 Tax=Halorussus amylolyticus TaxID=1126242 RepID=UPI001046081C|nr:hypothetical protein [Halorussus amylolyticus]